MFNFLLTLSTRWKVMNDKKLVETISNQVTPEEMVALLRKLISFPSHCDVPTREIEVVNYLEQFFIEQGIPYELQPVDDKRSNIIACLPGSGGGKSLMLNGHLDTVPPYNMQVDPFAANIEGNKIFGRGAVDMKGPITAMIMTLVAFKRAGIQPKGDLYFTGVLAEETNSDGCETLIDSGFRTDGAIVGEPSNREYAIGHRGLEWLEIEFIGKPAHGGVPDEGVNAIVNAAKFIMRAQEKIVPLLKERHHPHMGPSVMNFGRIEGGTQPSTVADRCKVILDRRYIPAEQVSDVLKEYADILEELFVEDPSFKGVMRRTDNSLMKKYYHVPMETSPDDPLVHSVTTSLEYITNSAPKMTTRRGWTDAAILSFYGKIPTVVYGPGDISRSHTPTEYITIDELVEGFKTYSLIVARYCAI